VVTKDKAAVWTDSRYFIQAEAQLDKTYWTLMKSGEKEVPSIENWLASELRADAVVAATAKFVSISCFN
jgi:Xaa-Pro aminopeptidase